MWGCGANCTICFQDSAFPFQHGASKVQNQTQFQTGNFDLVQYLAPFVIGDGFNHLRIDDDGSKCDEVRKVFPDLDAFVNNFITELL